MTWLKRHVPTAVNWLLILLTGAVIVGVTSAQVSSTAARVDELHTDSRSAAIERAATRLDLSVIETRQQGILESQRSVVAAVDRLEAVTARLEALAGWAARPK